MIFTEEDFEDVSEETKANSPKHRKRSRRTSGGFPARKAGIIAGGVIGVLVLLYLGISVFFMSHFYINTTINGKDFSGLLGNFLGMLTDSRSFLSYSRHEYFRRILCELIGGWVENGEYPNDERMLGKIIKDISYNNAVRYFGFDLKEVY